MSEQFTMPRKLAHELLGALFNGPGLNPAGYEALKQDFAARLRASPTAPGRVAALEALHTAVVDHRAMFEGTSDEFNMTASAIVAALDLLDGPHCATTTPPTSTGE
ncbi:hypothetical protein NHH73_25110 [Oxalobacteraceae bacterium OTU3CINTB1]|nr:hypothetical protein NHH73_25110 [Oxalobacteraceae bacterium OTU3CINTB1]